MARIRTVKPDFFRHEGIFEAEMETGLPLRLAYIGLWTTADKSGRFRWRPRQLKLDCMPYDDVDFSRVLDALATRGFLVKYRVGDEVYGAIPSWERHQAINNRESDSILPCPSEGDEIPTELTRGSRVDDASFTRHGLAQGEREREREGEREGEREEEGNGGGKGCGETSVVPAKPSRPQTKKLTDDEWLLEIKKNPAYLGIDIDREIGKCQAWCLTNRKTYSRQRLVNWLNRVEKPMMQSGPSFSNATMKALQSGKEFLDALEQRDISERDNAAGGVFGDDDRPGSNVVVLR